MSGSVERASACAPARPKASEAPAGGGMGALVQGLLESSSPVQEERREGQQQDGRLLYEDAGLPGQLQSGLQTLRLEETLTDVTLQVQGQRFPCHRAVLAAASQYFRAMFCNDLREKYEEMIVMQGVDADTMAILLTYTYTSQLSITKHNIQKTLEAASLFQFQRIVDACASFLSDALRPDNCVGILQLADVHSLPTLVARAQAYVVQNFSQVVAHDEFLDLSADMLARLLQPDELAVTKEEQAFEAAMRWVRAQEAQRVGQLPRVLRQVRLPLLDPWYFVERVEGDPLIRQSPEAFPLLQEVRLYHLSGNEVISERTKPRILEFQSEVFMIIGGCTKDERFVSEVTCLDPLRRSRLEVAKLPMTETESETDNKKWVEFACVTFRNEVYISGGKETQNEVWRYNAALNKWTQVEYIGTGRWRHKMAVLRGKVYVLGGFDGLRRLKSVEAYDPFHNCWTEVANLLLSVSSFSAASYDKWIYVIGGGPNGKLATNHMQCFEPSSNHWSFKCSMPVEAKCTNAVTFKDSIYVVGGAMRALYSYSPREDAWTLVTQLGGERASCGLAACNNRLFITGGRGDDNEVIASVLCWDPEAQKMTEECVLPRGVSHHGSVTLRKSYTHIRKIVPEPPVT